LDQVRIPLHHRLVLPGSEDLAAILRDEHGVLELRAPLPVPPVPDSPMGDFSIDEEDDHDERDADGDMELALKEEVVAETDEEPAAAEAAAEAEADDGADEEADDGPTETEIV